MYERFENWNEIPGCAPHIPGSRGGHPMGCGPKGPNPHEGHLKGCGPKGPGPRGGHPMGCGPRGGFPGGFGPHGPGGPGGHRRPHGKITDSPRYAAEDKDGKLLTLLRVLGHLGHHMEGPGGQGRILSVLKANGEMTQRALTEMLGIQPGSASEIITKLERAGLVIRTPNPDDRRTADISLTEAGEARAEVAAEKAKTFKEELLSALTEEEKDTLLPLLEKLCTSWEEKRPQKV